MRSTVIGIVLAIAFIAALFAVSRMAPHRTTTTPNAPAVAALTPEQAAAKIGPKFVGGQRIGDWTLACGPGRELPRSPPVGGHASGNSEGTAPKEAPPPPGWKIPRCKAMIGLRDPKSPADEIRISFRLMGFKRVLAMYVRLSPNMVQAGDTVMVRADGKDQALPVRGCAMQFCLALQSIRKVDEPSITGAKSLTLHFRPTGKSEEVSVPVSTTGLAPAIAVVHRIDR